MTMIVTQHLHHAGTYRQFWIEQQMVLTSMSHHLHSHYMWIYILISLPVCCIVTFHTISADWIFQQPMLNVQVGRTLWTLESLLNNLGGMLHLI